MVEIRYVQEEDKEFWYSLDKHLPEQEFSKKVCDKRGYVLLDDGRPIGVLRYNLFWDNTPFCTLLFIDWNYQGKGLTSFAIAKEIVAKVYANDLWISAEENAERFEKWGIAEQVIPVHEYALGDKRFFESLIKPYTCFVGIYIKLK